MFIYRNETGKGSASVLILKSQCFYVANQCFNATDPVIPVYSSNSRSNTCHALNVTFSFQWDSTGLARRSSVVKSSPLPQLPTRASCFHFAPRDSLGFFWWEDELADVSRMKLQMSQRVRMLQSLQMSSSQKLNLVCHLGVLYLHATGNVVLGEFWI